MRTSPSENYGVENVQFYSLTTGPYNESNQAITETKLTKYIKTDNIYFYGRPKPIERITRFFINNVNKLELDIEFSEIINYDFPILEAYDGTFAVDASNVFNGAYIKLGGEFAAWVEKAKTLTEKKKAILLLFDSPRLQIGINQFFYDATDSQLEYLNDLYTVLPDRSGIFTTELGVDQARSLDGYVPNENEFAYVRLIVFDREAIEATIPNPFWDNQSAMTIFAESINALSMEYV